MDEPTDQVGDGFGLKPNPIVDHLAAVINRLLVSKLPKAEITALIDHVEYVVAKYAQTSSDTWWEGYRVGYSVAEHLPQPRPGESDDDDLQVQAGRSPSRDHTARSE